MILTGIDMGSIAEWFGAAGTIGAVVFAVFSRKKMPKIIVKATAYVKDANEKDVNADYYIPGDEYREQDFNTYFEFTFSNLGDANELVQQIKIDDDDTRTLLDGKEQKPFIIEAGSVMTKTLSTMNFELVENDDGQIYDEIINNHLKLSIYFSLTKPQKIDIS